MIEQLVKCIQTNNQLDSVYSNFHKVKVAHHKDLLLTLCIEHNQVDLFNKLLTVYPITDNTESSIIQTTLKCKHYFAPTDHFKYSTKNFEKLSLTEFNTIFQKGEEAVDNLIQNQTVSVFLNFNKFIIAAFNAKAINTIHQVIPFINKNKENALFMAIVATYYNHTDLYPLIFKEFAKNSIYIDDISERQLFEKASSYFISQHSYKFKFLTEEQKKNTKTVEEVLQIFKDETAKAEHTITWESIKPSTKKTKTVKF